MLYLFNNKQHKAKLVRSFLKQVLGIGGFLSEVYCKSLGFNRSLRVGDLSSKQRIMLEHQVVQDRKNLKLNDLLRTTNKRREVLASFSSLKGLKHKKTIYRKKASLK